MIARFIITAATTAATMAASHYVGKAIGEKIRKDHGVEIDAFKARQAALKLKKHLIRGNTLGIKNELCERLWALHKEKNESESSCASALFVLKDRTAAVIVIAVKDKVPGGKIIVTLVEGVNTITRAVYASSTQAAVKAVIGDNFFIEGYNLDEEPVQKEEDDTLLTSLIEGCSFK
jgi:hypothetical protein